MVHRHAPAKAVFTPSTCLNQLFQTPPLSSHSSTCGEGACPRSAAKQSQNRKTRCTRQSPVAGFSAASQRNGGKPPRHKQQQPSHAVIPSQVSALSLNACGSTLDSRELALNVQLITSREAMECQLNPTPTACVRADIPKAVGHISSPPLSMIVNLSFRIGIWDAYWLQNCAELMKPT